MGKVQMQADSHDLRLQQARHIFFDQGMIPEGLVAQQIARSWERCRRFGLNEKTPFPIVDGLDRFALKTEQDRNRTLLQQGRAIMEQVYEQIRESGSMVILADANGLLLDTVGDPDFVDRADRVALTAGASWDENQRGTNAIGTALDRKSVV